MVIIIIDVSLTSHSKYDKDLKYYIPYIRPTIMDVFSNIIVILTANTSLQLCREVLYGDHGECWKLYCELDWEHIIKPTVLKNSIKRHNLKVIPDSYNDTDHDRICEYEESLKRMKYTFY